MASDWVAWQLVDSAFPAGSLAHSHGLESAVQHGWVSNETSLCELIDAVLRQLNAGVAIYIDKVTNEPGRFKEHDADCDLFLNSSVANRASRAQGQAILATAAQTFDSALLKEQTVFVRQKRTPGHLAPTFGLIAHSLQIEKDEARRMFAFLTARSCFSAAVRLGVIGPLAAQRMMAAQQWPMAQEDSGQTVEPVQTTPMLDLLQSTQDRLYSRLFQS